MLEGMAVNLNYQGNVPAESIGVVNVIGSQGPQEFRSLPRSCRVCDSG